MKKLSLLFVVFLFAFTVNSCKKINDKKMTVEKDDCYGYYLKYLEKRYYVCNSEMLSQYSNGDKVHVSLRKVKPCSFFGDEGFGVFCDRPKDNGAVEVLKVK